MPRIQLIKFLTSLPHTLLSTRTPDSIFSFATLSLYNFRENIATWTRKRRGLIFDEEKRYRILRPSIHIGWMHVVTDYWRYGLNSICLELIRDSYRWELVNVIKSSRCLIIINATRYRLALKTTTDVTLLQIRSLSEIIILLVRLIRCWIFNIYPRITVMKC